MFRKTKVLAGGAFNILHPGHIHFLREAKALGDSLIVVIASDKTVTKNKDRLLFPARERGERVDALSFVDNVVTGDENDMSIVVREIKPDIVAIGYDQDEKSTRKILDKAGTDCRIVRIGKLKEYSTKKIMGEKK